MPATIYTQEEVDKLIEGVLALIPTPMPDNVKVALRTVLQWLIGQV